MVIWADIVILFGLIVELIELIYRGRIIFGRWGVLFSLASITIFFFLGTTQGVSVLLGHSVAPSLTATLITLRSCIS